MSIPLRFEIADILEANPDNQTGAVTAFLDADYEDLSPKYRAMILSDLISYPEFIKDEDAAES